MEHLEYKVEISAPAKQVWETMLQEESYQQWVAKSWPNSSYEGKWAKGEKIKFIGSDGSGTLAEIVEMTPYKSVTARHIAVLGPGGVEDRTDDIAKGWIGTTEGYQFAEHAGKTILTVIIETTPAWTKMFDDGWPDALEELKKLAERHPSTV